MQSYPKANVFISPYSVANSLALLTQGSNGDTLESLKRALQLTGDKQSIANGFNKTHSLLLKGSGSSAFNVANKIYIQNGYSINKRFETVARQYYNADVENVDFEKNEDAAKTMNQYVEQQTNHMIKDFIEPSMIRSDSRLVLINALYFKGAWENQFSENRTTKGNFFISQTESEKVDYMTVNNDFNYAHFENLAASAIEMKYKESNLSFVIVLPNSISGLPALESNLQTYDLAQIVDRMEMLDVDLYVPKFKIEFETSLNEILKNVRNSEKM